MLALGLGLLVGLERGWRQRDAQEGGRIAGMRTFGLLGLGGGLCGLAARSVSVWFGVVGMAGIAAAILLAHRARLNEPDDNISATNAIAGLMTAMLGLLATTEHAKEAAIATGAATLLLSMRQELHAWLRTLNQRDIRAAAQYGAITLVMLPLLPDRAMGPYDALNPRMLWLVVVFVTGLSFAGYWASKRFGDARGTILASTIGASYSSTAVTLELSRRLRAEDADRATLNASIAAATAIMPVRTVILCAVVAPPMFGAFAFRIGPAVLCAIAYALIAAWRASRRDPGKGVASARNPFDFWPAVGFAAMVAAIVVASRWAIEQFGAMGATFLIGLTGIYDVDAAIIAGATLPAGMTNAAALAFLLTLPVLVNNIVKTVLVILVAGPLRGAVAAIPLALVSALIGAAMLLAP